MDNRLENILVSKIVKQKKTIKRQKKEISRLLEIERMYNNLKHNSVIMSETNDKLVEEIQKLRWKK